MNYEMMLVSNLEVDVDALLEKVEKSLKEVNSQNIKVVKLGKKILAYPIAKQTEAEYVIINFENNGEAVNSLSSKLRLEQEAILRYLITKAPKAPKVTKVTKEPKETKVREKRKVVVRTKVAEVVTKVPKVSKGSKGTKEKGKKEK